MHGTGALDVSLPPAATPASDQPVAAARKTSWLVWGLRIVFLLLFAFTSWRLAWMSDDALITVRAALNANEGIGFGYNSDERVQAFTHPLWFFVIWATGAVFGSWIYGLIYVSLAIAVITVAVILWQCASWYRLLYVGLALSFSNTVIEWTSSGLEGPLAALLIVLAWKYLRPEDIIKRPIWLGLLVAAIALTRLDFVVVLIPIVVMVSWTNWRSLPGQWPARLPLIKFWSAAILPVALYLLWSKAYFGFALPSTYYAKTNTTIPKSEIVVRGWDYLITSSIFDLAIPLTLVVALVVCLLLGSSRSQVWMLGVGLYLLYIVWVGGDFMAGRFLLVPLVISLLVIGTDRWRESRIGIKARAIGFSVLAGILVVATAPQALVVHSGLDAIVLDDPATGVIDERGFYAQFGRALDPLTDREIVRIYQPMALPDLEGFADNWTYVPLAPTGRVLVACGALGNAGLWAGPTVHLIDTCGLTDRFIAGIPFSPTGPWRIGHFERPMPEGYEEAVKTGDCARVVDGALRATLCQLWTVIR